MSLDHDALVTVGIPTYNRPEGLRKTLDAITNQSFRNLEIIISDNCSTDPKVRETAEEFSAKDSRIRYHCHKTNLGAVPNFFSLLDIAHGKYFMWAADDDWWDTDFVKVSVQSLLEHEQASVTVACFEPLPDPKGKMRRIPRAFDKIREFENLDLADRLVTYILQKDTFGKAHIIYGMFTLSVLKQCVDLFKSIVEPVMTINDFYRVDVFLNAIILSKGHLVTTERCLRRFNYGSRGGGASVDRLWRGIDPNFHSYYQFMLEFIHQLEVPEYEKEQLKRALRLRKWLYYLERVGKKLIIYRLYWSLYKRFAFMKC